MEKRPKTFGSETIDDATAVFRDTSGQRWRISVGIKSKRGRADIHSLTIESLSSNPINKRILSEIPIDDLFGSVLVMEDRYQRKVKSRVKPHNGRRYTDEELQIVADVYLAAYRQRISVQRAVAEAMGVGLPTAAKRIIAARERGFIPADINASRSRINK